MIFSIHILDKQSLDILYSLYDLSTFSVFKRSTIKDMMVFIVKKIAQNTDTDLSVAEQELGGQLYKFYICVNNNINYKESKVIIFCTDNIYSLSIAQKLFNEVLDIYNKESIIDKYILKKYDNPKEHEEVELVLQELEETKIIATQSLETLLTRGESVQGLSTIAEKMQSQASTLFTTAKNKNKCCKFF